jgi:hypothetical protein
MEGLSLRKSLDVTIGNLFELTKVLDSLSAQTGLK